MSKLDLPDWHDWVECYYRKSDVLALFMNNYNGTKGDGNKNGYQ